VSRLDHADEIMGCPATKNEGSHNLLYINLLDEKMMNSRACDDTLDKINGPIQGHML
jgi:hypothetical protein